MAFDADHSDRGGPKRSMYTVVSMDGMNYEALAKGLAQGDLSAFDNVGLPPISAFDISEFNPLDTRYLAPPPPIIHIIRNNEGMRRSLGYYYFGTLLKWHEGLAMIDGLAARYRTNLQHPEHTGVPFMVYAGDGRLTPVDETVFGVIKANESGERSIAWENPNLRDVAPHRLIKR